MPFDFEDNGSGPALLFVPGSYSTFTAWRKLQDALKGSYRIISTSLPGYGGSKEVRDEESKDMVEMVDFVVSVIEYVDEPVHLVGHSYGGLTVFASVLSGKISPLSMITFEANPVFSCQGGRHFPWIDKVRDMVDGFETAIASGDPNAAGIIIDFWSRPGVFRSMPGNIQDYCRSKAKTNLIDWRTAAGFTPNVSDYGAINSPCSIVRGEHANRMMVDISNEITRNIPNARSQVVSGSDHFLISTHPEECAVIIDEHMATNAFV
jgi:pimeloyl-ACP methyl ester carboxylesterase